MLSVHELWYVQELTLGCADAISTTRRYIALASDDALVDLMNRHIAHLLTMHEGNLGVLAGHRASLSVPTIETPTINAPMRAIPMTPPASPGDCSDRDIATSYLMLLKRLGREYAWGAMESCTAEARGFLEDAFRTCSHQAYEVWHWMVEQGYYPIQAASQDDMGKLIRSYESFAPAAQIQ